MESIGIYAGSFNPFHIGHLNILEKSVLLFDTVIVARGVNPDKNIPIYELPTQTLNEKFIYVECLNYPGLLSRFIKSIRDIYCLEPTLIRGLRNSLDFEYEKTQIKWIREFYPELRVVHIMCDPEFEHISSSAIRSLTNLTDVNKYIVKI